MIDARKFAHEHFTSKDGNGCEMVVKALASIGQVREHSERCDQDTAFAEMIAARAVDDYRDDHRYDGWGEDE